MTDFVLQIEAEVGKEDYQVVAWQTKIHGYERINKYANFLKQPLTLGMFVPCDDDGNVLEDLDSSILAPNYEDWQEYQKAQSKVLFNGFVFTESQKFSANNKIELSVSPYGLKNERLQLTKLVNGSFHTWFQLFTIEDLNQCNLDLAVSF